MKQLACILAFIISATAVCAQTLTIATRGQPAAYTIMRSTNASPSQVYAAEELQKFTEQMTGVKLAIVTDDMPLPANAILLGNTAYTARLLGKPVDLNAFGECGFMLKTCFPHLLITGSGVRGTLYGVYEVLERFGGCRWYTTWHSVIPQRDVWTIPSLDETQTPAFAMREPYWYDMFDGDLAARNKANGNSMRLADKHGGKIRFGRGLFVHTANVLCPPKEFFATHPEYFSEINGKRVCENTQLCLTNPDVRKIVTERLLERIRKDPGARLFSVSQNDWHNFCTCTACKAIDDQEESHAGTMIQFVNGVAEAVEKEFPNVWIETLAYQYTRKPPKTIRPRRNVVPRLCTIECDFSQPLDQSAFEQNRRFVEEIRGWSAITDKLYIWDYTTSFRNYIGPFPNVMALQGNAKFFRDNHVIGLFEQGAYHGRHGDFAELKAWLLAKWLWNQDCPVKPLLDDFFAGYYGAAAPIVRRYFDELHTFHNDPVTKPLRIFDDVKNPFIPDAFYERAAQLWQQAEDAVKGMPAYSYNVRMGAVPVLYARLARLPPFNEELAWTANGLKNNNTPSEHRVLAAELLSRFREAKNISISESEEHHSDELSSWMRWTEILPYLSMTNTGLRVDVSPEFGGIVGALVRLDDNVNFLNGNAGGVEIRSVTGSLGEASKTSFKKIGHAFDKLVLESSRGDLKDTRTVTLKEGNLCVVQDIHNTRTDRPAVIRPVTRIVFALGANPVLCWRSAGGAWQLFQPASDAVSETFTLLPSQVPATGFQIASPVTRLGVGLIFEGMPRERYSIIVDRREGTVTLFAPETQRELLADGKTSSAVTLRPLPSIEGLPAVSQVAAVPMVRTVIEDWLLNIGNPGIWGDYAADPLAEDGSAIRLTNIHYEWCTTLNFSRVSFEPGRKYRIRMRVRVEKEPGREGEAFWAGVYDTINKKGHGSIDRKTAAVGDGYAWYDVAEWGPERSHYFWIGPGRFDKKGGAASAIRALYIDKLELIKVD